MHIPYQPWRRLIVAAVVCSTCRLFVIASDQPTLSKEQIKQFLLTAKVVNSRQSNKGITNPWRLTLTDGTVTHDASFQAVDEHKARMEMLRGTELAFVDSYISSELVQHWFGTARALLCTGLHFFCRAHRK